MADPGDFQLPSPKRRRTESMERKTSSPQPEIEDDFDDVYNTPPPVTEDPRISPREHVSASSTDQPPAAPPAISIPGLGFSNNSAAKVRDLEYPESKTKEDLDEGQTTGKKHDQANELQQGVERVQDASKSLLDDERAKSRLEELKTSEEKQKSEEWSQDSNSQQRMFCEGQDERAKTTQEDNRSTTGVAESLPASQEEIVKIEEKVPAINHEDAVTAKGNIEDSEIILKDISAPGKIDTTTSQLQEQTDAVTLESPAVTADQMNGEAEYELDSSPLVSSSSDISTDSSDDDSDDEANDYPLLSPEEQARRLMLEDGDSDDDGQGRAKPSRPLRTQNEQAEEQVPKPDITVTEDMKIEELGLVDNMVENLVLVKAKTTGEYQVLEVGSVLCLEDRQVVGAVAETLGRVQQPYYSIRFTNASSIKESGLAKDVKIFYVVAHSTTVFTQALKAAKGSDASNIYDEEVGNDELEFSDDEAEAEHKRMIKMQKQARRGGRDPMDGFSRGPRGRGGRRPSSTNHTFSRGPDRALPSVQELPARAADISLNYDGEPEMEVDAEDLYTPLARPKNLHDFMGHQNVPADHRVRSNTDRVGYSHRSRGDRGSRRSRGRGYRGHRGEPERQMYDKRVPQPNGNTWTSTSSTGVSAPGGFQSNGFPPPPPPPITTNGNSFSPSSQPAFPAPHQQQAPLNPTSPHGYSPTAGNAISPYINNPQAYQFQQPPVAQQYYQPSNQAYAPPNQYQGYPPHPANYGSIPAGAHINPAFFNRQQHYQQNQ